MRERIGNVRLENRLEGSAAGREPDAAEKRLLEIVTLYPEAEYAARLAEQPSWPLLKQFSPLRENLMNWIPIPPGRRVLELGAECGPVTGAFLGKGLQVTSVDASPVRCRINALRHREAEGLLVLAADPEEALAAFPEPFDLVAWPCAPELARAGEADDGADGFVRRLGLIRQVLKPGGALFLAMENPLGLKYFAGRPEEATGRLFESVEGFPSGAGKRTLSRRELIRAAEESGFEWEFYYPYPDHWLPEKIFTEACLPREGELNRNWQCFDADRVIAFNEGKAFDAVLRAGLFPEMSNAFLLCLRRKEGNAR